MHRYTQIIGFFLLILIGGEAIAQKEAPLFTFDKKPVYRSEFDYVYQKNNQNESELYTAKSVEDYLDLYINFKLKVNEAEAEGLDQTPAFKSELGRYRQQLSPTYLNDREITEELMQEAYKRMQEERRVSHLLLLCPPDAPEEDTLRLFEEINIIYKEVSSGGKTFRKAAETYSEDPSVKENSGDLGYITAFNTIYAFENVAYNTPVKEISKPIRSKYGYHLLKVEDSRPTQGKVNVAQILLKIPKFADDEQKAAIKSTIFALQDSLVAGAKFEDLALRHSEDKTSSRNGGSLGWFGVGKMTKKFEDAAFDLKVDQVSKPFQTQYGWHIVKMLDRKEIGTFKQMKSEILRKVQKDTRSESAKSVFIDRLKKEYLFEIDSTGFDDFVEKLDILALQRGNWKIGKLKDSLNHVIAFIDNKGRYQRDFAAFIERNQNRKEVKESRMSISKINWLFDAFVEEELIEVEESNLEDKHPEFKRLLQEYRDGILLFELTKQRVWDRATNDSIGLLDFYERNKNNYLYEPRLDAKIFHCPDEKTAAKLAKTLEKRAAKRKAGKSVGALQMLLFKFNSKLEKAITYEEDVFLKGDNDLIDSITWEEGVSRRIPNDGGVSFVLVEEHITPYPKPLAECKGFVISDYQTELEQNWVKELRTKYPVDVNRRVLNKVIKK